MKIHKIIEQGTPEWHALRLGRFGSTDAQAVATAGKGLETLAYQKVAEIISGTTDDVYINADMERGNNFEDVARSAYEMETGNIVNQVGYIELNEYVGGSPDGFVGEDGIIEIKCQRNYKYVRTLHTKEIETKYIWQIQHLLHISGRKWCDFIVFNENFSNLVIIRVERDEKKIKKLQAGLEKGVKDVEKILGEVQK